MERFSPRQLFTSVVLVSVAVSAIVAIGTIALVTKRQPAAIVRESIRETPVEGRSPMERELRERILRQDELVVAVVKRASPAVVSIVATKDVPVVEQFFVDPFGGDPFFRQFFGDDAFRFQQFRSRGTERRQVSAGTGFVISADGFVLTNRHVVADTGADYTAFFNDGTKADAKVLGRDPFQDLAVLKVSRDGLTVLPLGDSGGIEIGQSVIAIGNALGKFSNTVSVGVVSGLQRSIIASAGGAAEELQELIQSDAAINPGNSGGPLLNLKGEVIGINTALAQGAENIGFAIPINKAKRDIESVRSLGRIVHPFLGIRYVMVTKELQATLKLPVGHGALLRGGDSEPAITPGSPAAKAGLREGDIITAFAGERVEFPKTLSAIIQQHGVGETVSLLVRRGGETLAVSATLDERK